MLRNHTYPDGAVLRLDVDHYVSPYDDGLCAEHTITYDGKVIEHRYHESIAAAIGWGVRAMDAHMRA